jgi:hypothetical protein
MIFIIRHFSPIAFLSGVASISMRVVNVALTPFSQPRKIATPEFITTLLYHP